MAFGAATVIGTAVGAVTGIFSARAEAKENRRRVEAQRLAAKYKYRDIEANVILTANVNRENLLNAVGEIERVEASGLRDVDDAARKHMSTYQASGDMSLASGKSKGRQIIDSFTKENEAKADLKAKSSGMISQAIDSKDKQLNELKKKQISSYNELTAILSAEGPTTDTMGHVLGGAQQGFSIGTQIGSTIDSMGNTPSNLLGKSDSGDGWLY